MKKSRTFRKSFVAAIAALCLAAPLTVMPMTVSADTTYSIKITATDSATTHNYVAYQIFSGDYSGGILSNIQWGANVDQSKVTVDGLNGALGVGSVTETTASKVAEKLTETNSKAFADYIATCLKDSGSALSADGSTSENDYKVTGLSAGYYFVKDEANLNGQTASKTSYILKVVGDVSADAKSAIPTIVKKVQENTELTNDYTSSNNTVYDDYNDVADYNIGDDVPFLDDGTLPSDIGSYDEYYYQIVDTPGEKFTPNIEYGDDGVVDVDAVGKEVVVKIDGKEVYVDGDNVKVEYVDTNSDGKPDTITVTFENIKDVYEENEGGAKGDEISVNKDSHVTVEYTAKLDDDADVGLPGQTSEVKLNFSNDPNEDYTPSGTNNREDAPAGIGTTPTDKVIVFTYELDINKYLDDTNNLATSGVAFKIYRTVKQTVDGTETDVIQVATVANNKITGWVESDGENGDEVTVDSSGKVKFIGLDDGTYTLKETTTPAGYNSAEVTVTIDAKTENIQTWSGNCVASEALTNLTVDNDGTASKDTGIAAISIINQKGSSLPSTGGIGTTIFYLGGGTMAAVAGVYLITKKRMKNEEDDEI